MNSTDVTNDILPIDYLLINYRTRLFGALLVLLEKYSTDSIDTVAVTVRNGKGTLAYNPGFMEKLSFSDRCFVLMHEASHILLSSMSRSVGKNEEFWNIATDIIINELILTNFGLKPPKDIFCFGAMAKMKLAQRKSLRLDKHCADDIYSIILNGIESIKTGTYLVDDGCGGKKVVKLAHVTTKGGGKFTFRYYGEPFDDECLDPRLKGKIKEIIGQARDSLYGFEAGNIVRQLCRIMGRYFPFEMILKKVFEKRDYDFSRGNRRFKAKDTFLPRRKNPVYKVYVAVDVSGSCVDYTEKFLSYVSALPEFEEVVFFDTKITKIVKKGEPMPKAICGYGGTDMNAAVSRWLDVEKKSRGIKLNFVALTDGEIPEIKRLPKTVPLVFTTHLEVKGCKNIKIRG